MSSSDISSPSVLDSVKLGATELLKAIPQVREAIGQVQQDSKRQVEEAAKPIKIQERNRPDFNTFNYFPGGTGPSILTRDQQLNNDPKRKEQHTYWFQDTNNNGRRERGELLIAQDNKTGQVYRSNPAFQHDKNQEAWTKLLDSRQRVQLRTDLSKAYGLDLTYERPNTTKVQGHFFADKDNNQYFFRTQDSKFMKYSKSDPQKSSSWQELSRPEPKIDNKDIELAVQVLGEIVSTGTSPNSTQLDKQDLKDAIEVYSKYKELSPSEIQQNKALEARTEAIIRVLDKPDSDRTPDEKRFVKWLADSKAINIELLRSSYALYKSSSYIDQDLQRRLEKSNLQSYYRNFLLNDVLRTEAISKAYHRRSSGAFDKELRSRGLSI